MQAFVVRPVIVGLLALIAAGLWSAPFGTRASHAPSYQSDCRGAAAETQASSLLGIMIRRGARC
jgi:hypothetical protein